MDLFTEYSSMVPFTVCMYMMHTPCFTLSRWKSQINLVQKFLMWQYYIFFYGEYIEFSPFSVFGRQFYGPYDPSKSLPRSYDSLQFLIKIIVNLLTQILVEKTTNFTYMSVVVLILNEDFFFVMGWRDFHQKNKWSSSTIRGRRIVLVSNLLCIQMVGLGLSLWKEDVPLWSTISVFICSWNINLHRRLEQKKHYLWDYFYL